MRCSALPCWLALLLLSKVAPRQHGRTEMAQEQGDEWLRSKEIEWLRRDDFRHDGDDYREKVRDLKAAEFHEVSRALLEKAS